MKAIACVLALSTVIAGWAIPASANDAARGQLPGPEWIRIDPARLAAMRGGLQLPSGLALSFGIERLVYVNGELVASASVRIADVARITPEQAAALDAVGEGMVVQIGEGNRIDPAGGGVLVIQNSLPGQDIRVLTTLDVGVGTLGMLQEMNTYGALQGALAGAAGGP